MYNTEKDIYVNVSKNLAEGETIEFELLKGCSSVFILKEGCTALNMKPMTLIIYKPNLVWDTQSRVSESVEERKDVNSAVLIYDTLNHSNISGNTVKPERTIGKMTTMSYREFEKLITTKTYKIMKTEDLVVALYERSGKLIKAGDLLPFFKQYNNGEEGFDAFIKDKLVWRAPNSRMVKFKYDPFTGEKIDWEQIKKVKNYESKRTH